MDTQESTKYWNAAAADLKNGRPGFVTVIDSSGRACAHCHSPSHVKRCSGCFQIFYCSKACQRAHWRHHKQQCRKHQMTSHGDQPSAPEADDTGNTPTGCGDSASVSTCGNCKSTSTNMKRCSRCSVATYCSKACQQVDWPKHKAACKQFAQTKRQQESEWEAGKMFEEFARVLDPSRGQCASSSLLTWDQAREEAMRRHPDKRIVTRICNVTHERDINVVKMTSCLFLGRLARPHPYIFRQGWYLEDSTGDEIRVFFYLDHDRPALWFKWSQLQVGNFLCLEHAYVHVFLDGSTGFRVDDACDVSVIGASLD